MFKNLLHNRTWPIALDLGGGGIRMLQVRPRAGGLAVTACQQWQYPTTSGTDSEQRRRLAVSAVREMLRKGGFAGRRVVSALSCRDLNIKNVRLPHMPEHEMDQAVRWEAKERYAFEFGDDQLRFINAGQIRTGNEVRDEIILMAAPTHVIDEHLSLLEAMGLRPEHIEAEPVAIFRVCERLLRRGEDDETASVLLDLGHIGTRVIVARGRTILFIKEIESGGRQITEAVAKQLNLASEEAADLRRRTVLDDAVPENAPGGRESVAWMVRDAVREVAEALAREISLCLRYCSVTFRGLRLENVTLLGGGAYDPVLAALLQEHLNVACRPCRPLRGMEMPAAGAGGDRREDLSEWAVCAGLALRYAEANASREVDDGTARLSA